jgi:hypothetical protein
MNDYSKALSFYEHAVGIEQRSLPVTHIRLLLWKQSVKKEL